MSQPYRALRATASLVSVIIMTACESAPPYEKNAWKPTLEGPEEHWDKDCSGEEHFNGCDDCNPCTTDLWCDVPEGPYTPPWCVGIPKQALPRCVHMNRTTNEGQINDCFPILPGVDVRAGRCCVGVCVDNDIMCSPPSSEARGLRQAVHQTAG